MLLIVIVGCVQARNYGVLMRLEYESNKNEDWVFFEFQ